MSAIRIGPHVHVGKDYPLLTCTGCQALNVVACIGDGGGGGLGGNTIAFTQWRRPSLSLGGNVMLRRLHGAQQSHAATRRTSRMRRGVT